MAKPIAQVGGIALAPGVSRNGRLYTKKTIAGMVARVQDKIASGETVPLKERDEPITSHVMTQLTHHAAEDDSTRIVGRVTSMSLDESGRARFTADIAPTPAGRTIATLLDTSDGSPPFLCGVSGRMAWVDGARVESVDGRRVETGDELDLLGLDYTHKPGVTDAAVDTFAWTGGTKTETSDRVLIYESVQEALVAPITEETTPAEASPSAAAEAFRMVVPEPSHVLENGFCVTCAQVTEAATPMSKRTSGTQGTGGPFADPGYQADKKQRYQLDTKAHVKAAWSYISMAKNAKAYTAAQLKRIKGRIKAALKKFGVTVSNETTGWTFEAPVSLDAAVSESYVTEHYGYDDDDSSRSGSWSIGASNGPVNLNLSSYRMDPADLGVILRAAADAACKALAALDPDMDGDIDVDGVGPDSDTDDDAPSVPPMTLTGQESTEDDPAETGTTDPASESDTTPAPEAAAGETTEGDPAMPESTNQAAETSTAAPAGLTRADLDAAVAKALEADRAARKARKAAKAQGRESTDAKPAVTETALKAETTESEADRIQRLVKEAVAAEFPAESDDDRIQRLVREGVDAARAELVQSGRVIPGRKGIVRQANESATGTAETINEATGMPASWGDKPLHKMSTEELNAKTGPVLVRHVLGARADLLA